MAYETYLNILQENANPDVLTRANIGRVKTHPKIKGYFYVFIDLPDGIFTDEEAKFAQKWLSATCTNFTPHSKNLNLVDLNAQGGVQHSYIAGQTISREITLTFYEYRNAPIYRTLSKWMNMAIDPYVGVSALDKFEPRDYKGTITVIKTIPVGAAYPNPNSPFNGFQDYHIEHVWIYPGCIPSGSDQSEVLDEDVAAQSEVQVSYTFRFDGFPLTDDYDITLKQKAANLLNNFASENKSAVFDLLNNLYNKDKALEGATVLR